MGKLTHIKRRVSGAGDRGFTLVEVLVSLVIISLMMGVVVINLPQQKSELTSVAQSMATNMRFASHGALTGRQPAGVMLNEEGYDIVRFDGETWEIVQTFSYGMRSNPRVKLLQNGSPVDLEAAIKQQIPVIRFDTTGLATPYELWITGDDGKVVLAGGMDGDVAIDLSDIRRRS